MWHAHKFLKCFEMKAKSINDLMSKYLQSRRVSRRGKGPWRCISIWQVLQRTERSTHWCHSSIQVVWVQVQQSLMEGPTFFLTHVLASTQVGLLPACNPAQYRIWWASSKVDKVDKTLLGLLLFVPRCVDVFLGSRHSCFYVRAAWLSALLQTLQKNIMHVKAWEPPERERTHKNMGSHPCDTRMHALCSGGKGVQPPHDPSNTAR